MFSLEQYHKAITELCTTHKVKSLYAFGSVLTSKFNNGSDIDLIVDFEPMDVENYADNYFDFKFSLQDMLKRDIDLLEEKALKNPYIREAILSTRKVVYAQ